MEVGAGTDIDMGAVGIADMYRGIFKWGVFNAVQSTCFDDVMGGDKSMVSVFSSPAITAGLIADSSTSLSGDFW